MSLLDMNMNMNMALAMSTGANRPLRPRYNSDLESRLVDVTQPDQLVPDKLGGGAPHNYPTFHRFWDADLHACMYLDDFLRWLAAHSTSNRWRDDYKPAATANGVKPPIDMERNELGGQVLRILELALEREDRFAEIIDQDDADGAINYWLGMLKIDPARHPATFLMVHIGRRVGEHISMCLKGDFECPRPSQLSPAITPMIDPPVTPSFPAGHAVQSYLISYLLAYSLPHLPQHTRPTSFADAKGPLFDLAARVSENRVVAGIHYPVDIEAGKAVAIRTFTDLQNIDSIWGNLTSPHKSLRQEVEDEFPQYK
jgi:membrane-associated phospholipid phosphatase